MEDIEGITGAAGGKMVVVTLRTTYDLHTLPNKMSLIGIHTPDVAYVRKFYPGLFMQCKMMRFLGCDVNMACASVLPADPQQIGVESGDIAPQDMFNPILYKSVSNESMSTLETRLLSLASPESTGISPTLSGPDSVFSNSNVTGLTDEFPVYYGLLSNRDGFRTAMPQAGLSMTNLRPLVFEKLYNYGVNAIQPHIVNGAESQSFRPDFIPGVNANGNEEPLLLVRSMRGNAKPMPWFNTTYYSTSGNSNGVSPGFNASSEGVSGLYPTNLAQGTPDIPHCYVSCIVMPPAKLNQLYFRMTVSWRVEFSGIRPITEVTGLTTGLSVAGNLSYFSDYVFGSQLAAKVSKTESVDVIGGSIEKIMDGA